MCFLRNLIPVVFSNSERQNAVNVAQYNFVFEFSFCINAPSLSPSSFLQNASEDSH